MSEFSVFIDNDTNLCKRENSYGEYLFMQFRQWHGWFNTNPIHYGKKNLVFFKISLYRNQKLLAKKTNLNTFLVLSITGHYICLKYLHSFRFKKVLNKVKNLFNITVMRSMIGNEAECTCANYLKSFSTQLYVN